MLLDRARVLHPELSFADDAPSRFRKEGGGAEAPAAAPSAEANGAAPAAAAAASKPAAAPAPQPVQVAPAPAAAADSEYDPIAWEVPVVCKDCNEPFTIPYRHFQAGVVFHCPTCSGSYVPKSTMARIVRETFEIFYGHRRAEREALERRQAREQEALEAKQTAEMEAFKKHVHELGTEMKPAGKLVRPHGLAAMFT